MKKFIKVKSIDIPEIDQILSRMSQEDKDRISKMMEEAEKMVFVSAPYSCPIEKVVEYRMKMVSLYCAQLLKSGVNCLTPLTHGTCIFKYTTLPSDFEFWKNMSYGMLQVCDVMHVLRLPGWEHSLGVQAEIDFAKEHNIPILFINVDDIQEA